MIIIDKEQPDLFILIYFILITLMQFLISYFKRVLLASDNLRQNKR